METAADLQKAWSAATALVLAAVELEPDLALTAARRLGLAHRVAPQLDLDAADELAVRVTCLLADVAPILFDERNPITASSRLSRTLANINLLSPSAAALAARYERVDGLGKPSGLIGSQIPFAARLNSIFDGLVVGASGNAPMNWRRRIESIKDRAGSVVDIQLADAVFEAVSDPEVRAFVEQIQLIEALELPLSGAESHPTHDISRIVSLLDDPNDVVRLAQGLLVLALNRTSATAAGIRRYTPEGASTAVAAAGVETDIAWPDSVRTMLLESASASGAASRGSNACAAQFLDRTHGAICLQPILNDDELWGFVWASRSSQHAVSPQDRVIFQSVAHGVSDGVIRQQSSQHLQQLAHEDPLTGLANRWQLHDRLNELFAKGVVHRSDAALIMCDVDGLKMVNDTDGHAAGDDLLLKVARTLNDVVSAFSHTTVCRLGGDEFCVLLENNGLQQAETIAERATAAVGTNVPPGVGLSCGVAYAVHAETPSDLLAAADQAQYMVKRSRPRSDRSRAEPPGRRSRRDNY